MEVKQLYDNDGNAIAPITSTKAVRNEQGVSIETLVTERDAKLTELGERLSDLDKVINGEGEVTITPTAGSNFVAEIDVEEGDTIAISATASVALTQNSYITLLMGGTQIYKSAFILKTKTSGTIPPYHVTSSGKVTIKFEYNEYTENSLIFTIAPSIKGALETIKEIKSSLDEMNGEIGNLSELTTKKKDSLVASINEINSAVGTTIRNLTSTEIITGFYRVIPDGELVAMGTYSYTTPIKVYNGDIIRLNGLFLASVCAITKVDADNNVIKVLLVGKGADVSNYEYKIETDGFISISGLTTNLANVTIEHSNMPHYEPPIDNADHLWSITDNPLDYVKREAGYGAIIRNWGFIGDSYSSGETPAKNASGTLVTDLDFYGISWGQQFARIIGANGYNFSNGGQTAKGWLKSQGTKHDSSYIGGEGGGDWRHAQLDKKQAYFISLGINDNGYITRWEQEGKQYLGGSYTLGNLTTDVDWNNYANNNENTFIGCYAGIIQRVLSIQPKAKIFVVTQFQPSLDYINDAIRSIASKFPNNVFVVDLRRYAPNITDNMQYYMKNGHPTPYGYMYMAYLMNTYVDWIIRNNKDKFMDVTLIGTDYSL